MYEQRSYKPTEYPKCLEKCLDELANVNSINTDIDDEIVKKRYPLLPWTFMNLKDTLKTGYWNEIIMGMERKYGVYLQLLHYLETEDKT